MSSKNINNYYDSNNYNNNNLYNNLNYNNKYNQYSNNYNNYINNNYNYNNYSNYNNNNNQYGNVIQYYNNYPVYTTIPASGFTSNSTTNTSAANPVEENQNVYEKKDSELLKGKTALKRPEVPQGIMLKIKPQDICHARPPEYSPGFVGQQMGVPAYARQNSNA